MALVDDILKPYGMKWGINPYRITINRSIIQSGPRFDLREKTLKAQYNAYLRRVKSQFDIPVPNQK